MKTLRQKMIVLLLLVSFLPLSAMSAYSYVTISDRVRENTTQEILSTLFQITKNMEIRLNLIEKYSRNIALSLQINGLVRDESFDRTRFSTLAAWREIDEIIKPLVYDDARIKCIYIAKDGRFVYNYNGSFINEEQFFSSGEQQRVLASDGHLHRSVFVNDTPPVPERLLLFGRAMRDSVYNNSEPYATVLIFMRNDLFSNITMAADFPTDGLFFITDERGEILSESLATHAGNPQSLRDETFYREIVERSHLTGSFESTFGGERVHIFYQTLPAWGYCAIRVVSHRAMTEPGRRILMVTLMLYALLGVFVVVVSLALSRLITRPVSEIRQSMRALEQGNFDERLPLRGQDEFAEISTGFNHMASRLGELVSNVVRQERLRGEAQYEALQYQINPHFLYNTLASIRMSSLNHGDSDSAFMLKVTARLLKRVLSSGNGLVSVEREILNIQDYARIQKLHYGESFEIFFEVDANVLSCPVPNLLLQPFVENALFHGMDAGRKLSIWIAAKREDRLTPMLRISVSDDGKGMTEEAFERVLTALEAGWDTDAKNDAAEEQKPDPMHLGLANVRRRLSLVFGGEVDFRVENRQGLGVTVTMLIPMPVNAQKSLNEGDPDG